MTQHFVFRLDSFKRLHVKLSGVKTGWIACYVKCHPNLSYVVKYMKPRSVKSNRVAQSVILED